MLFKISFSNILFFFLIFSIGNKKILNFEIGNYSLYSYFFLFFLFFISLLPNLYSYFKKNTFNIQDLIKKHFAFFLLIFFILIGGGSLIKNYVFFKDYYPIKNVFIHYSLSIFILLIVPVIIIYFQQQKKEKTQNFITFFLLIQSLILIYDFIVTNLQYPKFAVGYYISDPYYQENFFLYRPHFLEQEPGYLIVYTLFLIVYLRIKIIPQKKYFSIGKKKWHVSIHTFSIYFLSLLSIIVTTSKIGILGIVIFIFYEIIVFISKNKETKTILKDFYNKKNRFINISILFLYFFIFLRFLYVFDAYYLNSISFVKKFNISKYYFDISPDTSDKIISYFMPNERIKRALESYEVFKENPILGVGINSSYYIYSHDFKNNLKDNIPINEPLAFNLYTELLSEWGLLGTIVFFIALFYFIRQKSILETMLILCLFLTIAISSENLLRFNLWFSLALLYSSSYHSKNKQLAKIKD